MTLRSPETQARYDAVLKEDTGRGLHDVPAIRRFKYWKIIPNDFPYDLVFKTHDMLLPKRVVKERKQLTLAEVMEYEKIIEYIAPHYDCVLENFGRNRSVVGHYHVHLMEYKND